MSDMTPKSGSATVPATVQKVDREGFWKACRVGFICISSLIALLIIALIVALCRSDKPADEQFKMLLPVIASLISGVLTGFGGFFLGRRTKQ